MSQRDITAGGLPLPPDSVDHWHTCFLRAVSNTGDDWSGPLKRLVDLKPLGVNLPGVFDSSLIADINTVSKRVLGMPKYPALQVSNKDSQERFEFVEPGCRPVVLYWRKHRNKTDLPLHPAKRSPSPLPRLETFLLILLCHQFMMSQGQDPLPPLMCPCCPHIIVLM